MLHRTCMCDVRACMSKILGIAEISRLIINRDPRLHKISPVYSYAVSPKKILPWGFLTFFPNGWEILVQILHAYYTFLSTLYYKPSSHHAQNVHHWPKRTLVGRT